MSRILILFLLTCFPAVAFAQKADSLFVKQTDMGWIMTHKVKAGENVFSLARRFHVPPATLADFNSISIQQELVPGKRIFIPVGAYNFISSKPLWSSEVRPVYFRVGANHTLGRIAGNSGVKPRAIQQWNNISDIREGQVVVVGWIRYDASESSIMSSSQRSKIQVVQSASAPSQRDTLYSVGSSVPQIPGSDTMTEVTEGERLYNEQTMDGLKLSEEKGTAAFFKRTGTSSNGVYFAFHDIAKRGTIIKVHNPGTGKTVYAKVIGTVPTTASYHNALIGLSEDARSQLDVFEDRAWVQVSYAP